VGFIQQGVFAQDGGQRQENRGNCLTRRPFLPLPRVQDGQTRFFINVQVGIESGSSIIGTILNPRRLKRIMLRKMKDEKIVPSKIRGILSTYNQCVPSQNIFFVVLIINVMLIQRIF
jgi:hypothetical protein